MKSPAPWPVNSPLELCSGGPNKIKMIWLDLIMFTIKPGNALEFTAPRPGKRKTAQLVLMNEAEGRPQC